MSLDTAALCADLQQLKIPAPDVRMLMSVYDIEGDRITQAVADVKQGNEQALKFLQGIFFSITPKLKQRLQRLNVRIPSLRVLIEIGKHEGPQFAARLKRWDETGNEGDDARYVRLTMAEFLELERSGFRRRCQESSPTRPSGTGAEAIPAGRPMEPSRSESNPPPMSSLSLSEEPGVEEPARQSGQGKEIISQHVYGGSAAACFSTDVSRAGQATVRIEVAQTSGNSRQYNWTDKVSIQLSQRELPLVLATLMQWVPKFEGKGHGTANEKWFTLENQGPKVFLSVNCKGKAVRGVPIMAGDTYALSTLLMRQMLRNDPFLTPESLLMLVRTQGEMFCRVADTDSNGRHGVAAGTTGAARGLR